ncbi:MAG: YdiU family protein [Thiohalophilus sp.]|uniref:protein adenylyltransferase SelO n=1 Tax=Thiohalophilus sp. TaxID=3028392 RepID=UPI002870AF7D|nr:YdiU family protein [Thiohalophilus sp.]MDR9435971.1 YdiU family protein [Thiohalophilus sp.]
MSETARQTATTLQDILQFDNCFARLPERFYSRVNPTPFDASHHLVSFNPDVARLLGVDPDSVAPDEWIDLISGCCLPNGCEPLAMLYAGHQFGHFVPQLGDGRAILLGEVRNPQGGKYDIQLKGSGLTPYSRSADGRAVLRSTIREYLCSEAMHGLDIPTTRALAIVGSDAEVYREQIETGAILARVAPSHVRFGSFEVFYHREQHDAVQQLADYVITEHYPDLAAHDTPYVALLEEVVQRTARLIAQWQAVGFTHGVLNTDNMSILGLTLDYGPFGFMEQYQPGYICNHSDFHGRYAFDQQPGIGLWNLNRLAQALIPLMSVDAAKAALEQYEPLFVDHYLELMHAKLGLKNNDDTTQQLITDLLSAMQANQVDYTRLFRALCDFDTHPQARNETIRNLFVEREAFDHWAQQYRQQLEREQSDDTSRREALRKVNPKYVLRNYMAQIAIDKAQQNDFSEVDRLLEVLRDPFAEHPDMDHYAGEPPGWANQIEVSCSS